MATGGGRSSGVCRGWKVIGTAWNRCALWCGRLVKSATISFGQVLDGSVVDQAVGLVRSADLLLTVGSSLQVYPAAGLPAEAVGHGVPLVVLNDEPTPYDDLAALVVRGRAGEVLGPAVEAALGQVTASTSD